MPRVEETALLLAGGGEAASSRSGTRRFLALGLVVLCHFFLRAMQFPIAFTYVFNAVSHKYNTTITAQRPCSTDNRTEEEKLVVKEVAEVDKYLQLAMFLPALVPTLLLGSLVDRVGRRLGLIIPTLGLFLRVTFTCVVAWGKLAPYFLLLPVALEAAGGGFAAMLLVAFGVVADLTPPGHSRTFRIALIEATQTIASSAGSYASAQMLEAERILVPLVVSFVLTAVLLVAVLMSFPETLERQEGFSCKAANPRACLRIYTMDSVDDRRWKLLVALAAFFLTVAVNFSSTGLLSLYLTAAPLCWNMLHVTVFSSVKIVVHWLLLLLLVKGLLRWLKLSDVDIGAMGCVSSFLAAVLMAYAKTGAVVYVAAVAGVGTRAVIPMIRSYMSNLVGNEEQGSLYAGLGCVEVLMAAAAGYVTYKVYQATLDFFPGLIYLVFALLIVFVLVLLFMLRCYPRTRRRRRGSYESFPSMDRPSIQPYDDPPAQTG